jgi:CBS domain-containing membrane protein
VVLGLDPALGRIPLMSGIPINIWEKLRAAVSAFIAIALMGYVSSRFLEGAGLSALVASMGASSVILFAVPHSPMAQPWAFMGGHLLSAVIGVACALWLPDIWLAAGTAVGLSIFTMYMTQSLHPPGGATALVPVIGGPAFKALGFGFVLTPVALNVGCMLVLAVLLNNAVNGHRYPARLKPKKINESGREDARPLERLGINPEDLHSALAEMNSYMDVSEADLNRIYNAAALHAYRREFGGLTCGKLMSRDLVTVEFATELDAAWALLRRADVKALPVIGRGRHVIGILTQADFIKHAEPKEYRGLAVRLRRLLARTPATTSAKPEVVGQIMTAPAVTMREDAHIAELAPLMSDRGLHHVPIVDAGGKLVGIIAQSDLIAALYRNTAPLQSSLTLTVCPSPEMNTSNSLPSSVAPGPSNS